MTGRYVLRNKTDKTYYRANRKGSWDNWVDNINLATVFYTTAINSQHRCMKDCEVVYINFVEEYTENPKSAWKQGMTCVGSVRQAFKDGAEYGYNKANEWHYMKDGLPKTSGRYLVYTGGEPFILDFATEVNSFGYWVVSLGDDWGVRDEDFETVKDRGEDEVIAWKEIVLPKESE